MDRSISALPISEPANYRRFLDMHAKVLPPVEIWLENNGIETLLPDWNERRRRSALASDLEALGVPRVAPVEPLFAFAEADMADLAGAAYVLEGSRLGGRLLQRSLEDQAERFPTAFLGHGAGQPLWQTFTTALSSLSLSAIRRERALLAARSVFAAYEDACAAPIAA